MSNKKIGIDEVIEQGLKIEADKVTIPPKEEVWIQISKHLDRQKTVDFRKGRKIKLMVVSVAFILYIVATPWIFPGQDAKAVGQRLVEIFHSVFGGETKVETISRENNPPPSHQPPPPEGKVPVETVEPAKPLVFIDVEEARKKVPFIFRVPSYIPEGYQLAEITYSGSEKEPGEVILRYKSANSEFKIIERKMPGDFAMSSIVRSEEATNRKVSINDVKGTLTFFNNGANELDFYYLGISIRIYGQIGEQEIVQIGKSML
ncbi:MAG: DUF4367 domain-containing protein [Thermincola sp.]|nr:DUF4367 domain-containing protein [Thermincola sp.]MDT3703263.1 DUF4367 domain-containing protein [Thermincola sp.]